jgi:Tfp pilus assembly protein PilN
MIFNFFYAHKQLVIILTICIVFFTIITVGWNLMLKHKVKLEANKNSITEQKLNAINAQILELKKAYAIDANSDQVIVIANKLQHRHFSTVMMLKELSQLIPSGVYLSEIIKNKSLITLKGGANLYKNINKFIVNVNNSNWFKQPILHEVITSPNKQTNQFILQCTLP